MSGCRTARPVLALVGNAPVAGNVAARIDAAERVVRFNDARGFGGARGSRVSDLFLVNRGGAAAEWLADPRFERRAHVAGAGRVWLPLDPASAFLRTRRDARRRIVRDDVDHTEALRARLATGRRAVECLPADHHERCCRELGLVPGKAATGAPHDDPDRRRPSTGFIALAWFDRTLPPEWQIVLYGFGFDGWAGHPWERERARVAARVHSGRARTERAEAGAEPGSTGTVAAGRCA